MPFLRWLDLDGVEKKMNKTAKEIDEFAQSWLEKRRKHNINNIKNNGSGEWNKGQRDFMDVLLSTVDDQGFHGHDANTIIKITCQVCTISHFMMPISFPLQIVINLVQFICNFRRPLLL